jgi:hypothetical protein
MEFDIWDRAYGDWHWHFATMDKVDNLAFKFLRLKSKICKKEWNIESGKSCHDQLTMAKKVAES